MFAAPQIGLNHAVLLKARARRMMTNRRKFTTKMRKMRGVPALGRGAGSSSGSSGSSGGGGADVPSVRTSEEMDIELETQAQIKKEESARKRMAPVLKLQSMLVNSWVTTSQARKLLHAFKPPEPEPVAVAEEAHRHEGPRHAAKQAKPKAKPKPKPTLPPLPEAIAIPHSLSSDAVRVAMALFGRVTDLENIDELLNDREALSAAEAEELYMRLGWLNLYNPMRAERVYVLDMALGEHRGMMELLACMGEPGETWQCEVPGNTNGALFRYPKEKVCIPGFTLRALKGKWEMAPDTIPHEGFFRMRYSLEAFDAHKVPAKREAMMPRVLVGGARFPTRQELPDPDVFPAPSGRLYFASEV